MAKAQLNKSATLHRLAVAVFSLEMNKGHLAWKVSDIARKAELSRPLVYRYLGSSKKEILLSALHIFSDEFYGFAANKKKLPLADRIALANQHLADNHEAALFYLKWRARKSWLQDEFITIEKKFQRQLAKHFGQCNETQILILHALIHGLVAAPFLNPSLAQQGAEQLERTFNGNS